MPPDSGSSGSDADRKWKSYLQKGLARKFFERKIKNCRKKLKKKMYDGNNPTSSRVEIAICTSWDKTTIYIIDWFYQNAENKANQRCSCMRPSLISGWIELECQLYALQLAARRLFFNNYSQVEIAICCNSKWHRLDHGWVASGWGE